VLDFRRKTGLNWTEREGCGAFLPLRDREATVSNRWSRRFSQTEHKTQERP